MHALAECGIATSHELWFDVAVDWRAYDCVCLFECWGYHHRIDEFLRWIDAVAAMGVRIDNSPAAVRWNVHKGYLRSLAQHGVRVPRTVVLRRHASTERVRAAFDTMSGHSSVVLKPAVSASGERTMKLPAGDTRSVDRASTMVRDGDVLIQEFIEEIQMGEISLVFFSGDFSHAVMKRPADGEFRVQSEYGGTVESITPAPEIVVAAHRALSAVPAAPMYARVDGVLGASGFTLMELELIDPELFLDTSPTAPVRFAQAILAELSQGSRAR
jgi:glutathione synthase/RimK-type ligase-like ATP-grasp enzyme